MGGPENKLQMLQISQNQILRMTILPECVFSIPVKFQIYFLALPFSVMINGPEEIKLEQI